MGCTQSNSANNAQADTEQYFGTESQRDDGDAAECDGIAAEVSPEPIPAGPTSDSISPPEVPICPPDGPMSPVDESNPPPDGPISLRNNHSSSGNTSRFPLVVCVVEKLLELDGIIKYEEAIKIPGLIVELPFRIADIIFLSHKWRSRMHPDDQQKTKFKQLKTLLTRKVLRSVQYVWMDFFCVPQDDERLKQQAIDSFFLYVRCCKYFVILVGNDRHSTLVEYNKRGWCRLERFAALSPVNHTNLKVYVHNANGDTFLEAARVNGAIPSRTEELSPIQGDFSGNKDAELSRIAPALLDLCQEILEHPNDDFYEQTASLIKAETEDFIRSIKAATSEQVFEALMQSTRNDIHWKSVIEKTFKAWFSFISIHGITKLEWASKQLSGPIPVALGGLVNVTKLYLWGNKLSGPIPDALGNLTNLEDLQLQNNQLSGPIPEALGGLVNLTKLYLWGNKLSGPIPDALGSLANLEDLRLSFNQLSGPIPESLSQLLKLKVLYLATNQLSEPIPNSLGNLTSLEDLQLSTNQLAGPIPESLSQLLNLKVVYLFQNQLSGPISDTFGQLTNLKELSLRSNLLSGQIPDSLGNLINLTLLSLSRNKLSGPVPEALGSLTNLSELYLYENQLSGPIPDSFTHLTKLNILQLNCNQLSGLLPKNLGKVGTLDFSNNAGLQLENDFFM